MTTITSDLYFSRVLIYGYDTDLGSILSCDLEESKSYDFPTRNYAILGRGLFYIISLNIIPDF